MPPAQKSYKSPKRDITQDKSTKRKAVEYFRVSTDMQAADGLSLDAQTAASQELLLGCLLRPCPTF